MILGLGQDTTDLTASFDSSAYAPDLSSADVQNTATDLSSFGSNSPDLSANGSSIAAGSLTASPMPVITTDTGASSGISNFFSNLLTGVGVGAATAAANVASGAITTVALQQTNAQRMAQGLPPMTAAGGVMTAAQMAAAGYSPGQIAAVQSQLAIAPTSLLIMGAIGIGALLLISARKS